MLFLVFASASFSAAQSAATVYTVSLALPALHLVHVRIDLPAGPPERDIQMPVWDSLYQVRDFAEYVNWIRAKDADGHLLNVRKVEKSLWRVSGSANGAEVEYEIFTNVPGPYGAELNSQHGFFNLAQILMYPAESRGN